MGPRRVVTTFGEVIALMLVAVMSVGWCLNIVTLYHIADGPITGMFVLRGIGIFVPPLGAILGFV